MDRGGEMSRDTLRLAFVGMRHGHIGSFDDSKPGYLHTFRQMDGLEIVAYCEDSDSSRLDEARRHHPEASTYDNLDDLIRHEDFDIACVALPANEIPAAGIALAEAGKHFYVEKQFARTADDLEPMVRAVRANGVRVMPGYAWRFHPVVQELRGIIDTGVLGRPLDLEIRFATFQVRPGNREPDHFFYLDETEGGGVLHMLGGHYIELMRYVMGSEVRSVQAMTGRPLGYIEEPLEDVALCAFEFENGAMGGLHAGYLLPREWGDDSALVYRGEDGWADWAPMSSNGAQVLRARSMLPAWSSSPERSHVTTLAPKQGYGNTVWMFDWLRQFVDDVRHDREPALTVDDALTVLRTIDAAYESARTGRRIELGAGA
jgi:predicted dehydrogenase